MTNCGIFLAKCQNVTVYSLFAFLFMRRLFWPINFERSIYELSWGRVEFIYCLQLNMFKKGPKSFMEIAMYDQRCHK